MIGGEEREEKGERRSNVKEPNYFDRLLLIQIEMEGKYAECHKNHQNLGGKTDGCQEFTEGWHDYSKCGGCGCGRNFHRKVVPTVKLKTEVVYTKCHKIHDFKSQVSVDGCQEFTPGGTAEALTCALCGCHRGFHRNEITTEVASTS